MIQRVVMIKLREELSAAADRAQVAAHTREVLGGVELVEHLDVALPADARTRREWDLVILVRFADMAAVEAWGTEPTHRAYVDVYLKPMASKIRAWNFELPE